MVEQGHRRADLGRLLGLDSSQVTRIFDGKRRIQLHEMAKIDEWLGRTAAAATSYVAGPSGNVVAMPGLVPLYGFVGAASDGRLTLAEQNQRGYVPMHPAQMHSRDAFALEVADISMSPRYEPGEIIYVTPNRWPAREQDCVIVTTDGEGMLKRFLRRDDRNIELRQFNPEREFDIPLASVAAVHAVVGRG